MIKQYLILILIILHTFSSKAQVEYLGTSDGLSNRYVSSIIKDQQGFVWFGTSNGLNRYDGYNFKIINQGGSEKELSNKQVNYILESKENNCLWIATDNGLNKLDQLNGIIKKYYFYTSNKPRALSFSGISSLCFDNNKRLLVGTKDGSILRINNKDELEEIYRETDSSSLLNMQCDKENNIWYCSAKSKLICINNAFKRTEMSLRFDAFFTCFNIENEIGFCGVNNIGIFCFDKKSGAIIPNKMLDSLNKLNTLPMSISKYGNTYIVGCRKGKLLLIDFHKNTCLSYSWLTPFKNDFGSNIIYSYKDENGVIWLGTDGGIIKINLEESNFEKLLWNQPGVSKISTRGICEDEKGYLYIGTYNGLFRYHPNTKKTERYLVYYKELKRMVNPNPFTIVNDTNGYVYMTSTAGFLRFDKKKLALECLVPGISFYGLYKPNDEYVFLGSYRGLQKYSFKTKTLTDVRDVNNKYNLRNIHIWKIIPSNDGAMWLACSAGLVKYSEQKGITDYYSMANKKLVIEEVLWVYEDKNKIVWLCTNGGGLIKIDTQKNTIENFTTANGLPNNVVYCGIEHKNILWLSTDNGLCSFNKITHEIINYGIRDGITDSEFNTISAFKSSNGKVFLGSINGITVFDPEKIAAKISSPKIILIGYSKFDSKSNSENENIFGLNLLDHINLTYKDIFVSFSFALNDYFDPQHNRFEYMLEGLNSNWISLENQHTLRLSSIPAGNYSLHIRGINSKGKMSMNEINLPIYMSAIFYKQWWFILIEIVLLIALVYSVFQYRIKQLLKIQHLRTKIASDLHDEVGSLLTRISIHTELIKHAHLDIDKNKNELNKIAETSRLATSTMSDVLWSVDARNDKAGNLIDRMREHADAMLLPLEIDVIFNHNLNSDKTINLTVRQELFLIFKECIHNIAKHSKCTEVTIDLKNGNGKFELLVSDNGKLKAANSTQGQGLKNMKMRADKIPASIEIWQQNGFHVKLICKSI